jgi:hypothetical protein
MALEQSSVKKEADKGRKDQLSALREVDKEQRLAVPIVGRNVLPDVDTLDPKEAAKQDPRIGPQDVPLEERDEVQGSGVTAGIRHDQMQGVQSAAWINDLDEEEILEEQLRNPANTAVAADRELAAAILGEQEVSPKTEAEMERGARAVDRGPRRGMVPTRASERSREVGHKNATAAVRESEPDTAEEKKAAAEAKSEAKPRNPIPPKSAKK